MFYLTAEEYVMKGCRRELGQKLELKRQLRKSPESKSDFGLQFFAEVGGRLRNLLRVSEPDTSTSFDKETSLECVAC
jgi:hypothetical protein